MANKHTRNKLTISSRTSQKYKLLIFTYYLQKKNLKSDFVNQVGPNKLKSFCKAKKPLTKQTTYRKGENIHK